MTNSITRFSSRVENYVKYRPHYPVAVLDLLRDECGLTKESVVADVGSGPGILSELFLKNGNQVFCIEPNKKMRQAAQRSLASYPNFVSVAGTAEDSTLTPSSVDLIAAGQAFHWFDQERASKEFSRILRPGGWVVLIWNERQLTSTPFLIEYEKLLKRFGTDYDKVRHERVTAELESFFAPGTFRIAQFDNPQKFDFDGLSGRVMSSSYAPEPGHPNVQMMMDELKALFDKYAEDGHVVLDHNSSVYYGHLPTRA